MFDEKGLQAPPISLQQYPIRNHWRGWVIYLLFRLNSLLPIRFLGVIGVLLGEIAYRLHRTTTIGTNVDLCFPDLNPRQRKRFIHRYYRYASQALLAIGVAWFASERRLRRMIEIQGREHIERLLADGRRIILLAPHFINLELGLARITLEWPMIYMYRRPDDIMLHQMILHARTRHGAYAVERAANLKPLLKKIRTGHLFYYLPDQDPDHADRDKKNYIFAPFFGVPTATFTAMGRLANMTDAAVVPCMTRQLSGGRYALVFKPPLEGYPTGDEVEDSRRMNEAIEQSILESPEQYYWNYRRFKTRPDNEPSPYRRRRKRP